MTDANNQQHASESERLFLLFSSSQPFLPNPVRSLLIYFEEHSFFPLIDYGFNLYTASSYLTSDYHPIIYQWQLPDGRLEPVTITIIPNRDSTYLLCWDLGSFDTAEFLIGSKTNSDIILSLKKILRAGLCMSNSSVAALTYESSPNQDIQLAIVDQINFSLARLPIILSSRLCLSPLVTCIVDEDLALFSSKENPIFVPHPLPYKLLKPEPDFSIWSDFKNDVYYKLPNAKILPVGDLTICNCLSSRIKQVEIKELEKYTLTIEEANNYLVPKLEQSLRSAMDYTNEFIANQATTANFERSLKLDRIISEADWTQIICECLDVTISQIQQKPQLLEERILELLLQFQNIITDNKLENESTPKSAKAMARNVQTVLNNHGFELGDSIEQFINLIEQFGSINSQISNQSEENIRLQQAISFFAEVNLIENDLETIMGDVANKYQEIWGDRDFKTDPTDNQAKYTESVTKLVEEATNKYPLPNFSFDDLL